MRWHIEFLKDGRNIKEVLQDYELIKTKVGNLEMQIIDMSAEHEKQMKTEQRKQKELNKKIQKLNKNMIGPLMIEIKVKDELIRRVKEENALNIKDLKMLYTILRIPKMTADFQRDMRNKSDQDKVKV